MILIWNQKQISIYKNNAGIYLKVIQDAVVNPDFNNEEFKYKVEGLQGLRVYQPKTGNMLALDYAEYLNSSIQSNLTSHSGFGVLYYWRNNCLRSINYSNKRINEMQGNIEKQQKIVDGIKLI